MQKDDLISRQAALDALGERPVIWSYNDDYTLGERNQYDMDRLAIETVPPAQPRWIPCSERLPDNDIDVLVTDGTDCAVAYWRTDAQAWDDSMHGWCDLYGLEVTAWMPLPKPWEGGQE